MAEHLYLAFPVSLALDSVGNIYNPIRVKGRFAEFPALSPQARTVTTRLARRVIHPRSSAYLSSTRVNRVNQYVPIHYQERVYGLSKMTKVFKNGARMLLIYLGAWRRFHV